jgi:hypothetical protein
MKYNNAKPDRKLAGTLTPVPLCGSMKSFGKQKRQT